MKKYVNVYWFYVTDALKEGKVIFCIDRGTHSVIEVGTLPVYSLVSILTNAEKDENRDRYEFYYIENVKEGAKNDNV